MRPPVQSLQALLHTPQTRLYGAAAGAAAVLCCAAWAVARARRLPAPELERRRRAYLAQVGRIASGTLTDARSLNGEVSSADAPEVLVYEYEVRGVTYQCGQDVSTLSDRVLGWKLDLPVSVRYDPTDPGNSILVSEDWGGHWGRSHGASPPSAPHQNL